MLKRLFLILAATALVAIATAQDFYHRPSPLAGRTILTLALFDEVKAELKLTEADNTKVEALLSKMSDEVQGAFANSNGDLSGMRTEVEKFNAKNDEEVLKLFTADQATRIKQLYVQFNGTAVVTEEWAAKDLGLTDDQKTKIKTLQTEQWQKTLEAFQGGQEQLQAAMKKIQDEFKADVAKVLTEDQTKKLKEMEGAKFEFKKSDG